jgi:D-sedoheptulose 7-phosphate isomerase
MYDKEALLKEYADAHPTLRGVLDDIAAAADAISDCFRGGGKVLVCGNGGSSADSAHIVGELLKGFLRKRPLSPAAAEELGRSGELGELMARKLQGSLPAIDLTTQQAILSAVANDTDPVLAYAQQLWGLGQKGDILIGLSTSGNARNVLCAGIAAKAKGMKTIALTGRSGGEMGARFDLCVKVPSDWTPRVQELQLPVYHLICALVEADFFAE